MKHHYIDLFERTRQYWTLAPNNERWAHNFADVADAPTDTQRLTLTGADLNWERAKGFAHLTELTLSQPNAAQLKSLADFPHVKALRISNARPKTLSILDGLPALRELALEYVSGVDDLSPLARLPELSALHLENLRRVSDFSPLGEAKALRYLAIYGTLDWNQPIESFDFLGEMDSLEFLKIGFGVRVPDHPCVFRSLLRSKSIVRLEAGMSTLPLEDFAWLEARLPHVATDSPPYSRFGGNPRPIKRGDPRGEMPLAKFEAKPLHFVARNGQRYERSPYQAYLLGKGYRMLSGTDERVTQKCAEHEAKYQALVKAYQTE